jgi:hypothetical protein
MYLCDYCKKLWDRHKMKEFKLRNLVGGVFIDNWSSPWFDHHFICQDCYYERMYVRD